MDTASLRKMAAFMVEKKIKPIEYYVTTSGRTTKLVPVSENLDILTVVSESQTKGIDMSTEENIEQQIQEKGLNAPRLTPLDIDKKIADTTYTNLPSKKCVICEITLQNGYTVRGESACVSPENFDQDIGNKIAFKNARDKIWQLEGYLLQNEYPC